MESAVVAPFCQERGGERRNQRVLWVTSPRDAALSASLPRSTKAVVYVPPVFAQEACNSSRRTPENLAQVPAYPDPVFDSRRCQRRDRRFSRGVRARPAAMVFYLSFLGKYFYRNPRLRHLRIEQFTPNFLLVRRGHCATTV